MLKNVEYECDVIHFLLKLKKSSEEPSFDSIINREKMTILDT